jgi:hypothetical protein
MSNYACQKIHLAAEMLRNSNNERDALANAYAMELSKLSEADLPEGYENRINSLLEALELPGEIETISGLGRAHSMVNSLSDDDLSEIIDEIFDLENELM